MSTLGTEGRGTAFKVMGIIGIALGAATVAGIVPRLHQREARAKVEKDTSGPRRVRVVAVRAGDATTDVTLPGTSAPFRTSTLYGKSNGFLRKNLVDVGDQVKAGQVLAEIDAPETAEEVRLAQARLDEAQANVAIVDTTAKRATELAKQGIYAQQQADDARAQANSAVANVATRKADLQRLQVLRGYQQILAPFDGIVSRRNVDPGALIGQGGGGSVALFEVADIETLRVFADVPDAYAADVKVGVDAQVFSPRAPGQKVSGKIARTSGVLDARTRTIRAEVHVRGEGAVIPGAFVYVKLAIPRSQPPPLVNASALIVRKEGTLVAKVENGKIVLAPVTLGRDFGKELELLTGAKPTDQVVVNPADDLETGQPVDVVPTPKS